MIPDKQVQHDVIEELKWVPFVNPTGISVDVSGGIVSLNGAVDSFPQKLLAVQAAQCVKGVRSVVEDIRVQLSDMQVIADEFIMEAAANLLHWLPEIPDGRVLVTVQNGHLTLDGYVAWQHQKDAAFQAIQAIAGIKNVSNFLFVKPGPNAMPITADIERALRRKADLEESQIDVEVKGNLVVLSGEVRTWSDRQLAECTTWSSPGVAEVVNKLKIGG